MGESKEDIYIMHLRNILLFLAPLFLAALTACGGGGKGVTPPQPATVTVKLSTVAKTGETPQIKGVTVSLLLPDGVTLKTVSSTKQTASGVIRYSGATPFSNLTSQLQPRPLFGIFSTSGSPGRSAVTISFIGSTAFGAGEFATMTCDIASGKTASESSFRIVDFHATGDSATHFADELTVLFDTPVVTIVK
jgi:hypothetical protein